MERRAIWRPRPDDPKTFAGWIAQSEWPSGLTLWTGLLCGSGAVVLAAGLSPWAFLAVPAILINIGRPKPRHRDLTALATIPAPGPAFACQMLVQRGSSNVVTGQDEGIVTFFDGWLHFAGLRTDFSIRSTDAAELDISSQDPRIFVFGATVVLRPRDPRDERDLYVAARNWHRSTHAEGGEPLLPPLTIHPTGLAKAWIDVIRMLANGIAASAVMLILLATIAFTGAGFFAVAPICFFSGDALWRLRCLRKLRKQDLRQLPGTSHPALDP